MSQVSGQGFIVGAILRGRWLRRKRAPPPEMVALAIVGGHGGTRTGVRFPVQGGRQQGAEHARLRAVAGQRDAQPFGRDPIPLGARIFLRRVAWSAGRCGSRFRFTWR